MKAGKKEDIIAQLRHDVCFNGGKAYVLMNGGSFDELMRGLAANVMWGHSVLHWIENHILPPVGIEKFNAGIEEKARELRQSIVEVTSDSWVEHLDDLYIVEDEHNSVGQVMFVGDYYSVMMDVFIKLPAKNNLYVVEDEVPFDRMLKKIAADSSESNYTLWQYENGGVPKCAYAEYMISTGLKFWDIKEHVFRITEQEMPEHRKGLHVVTHDVQMAVDTFAQIVSECNGDLAAAVERFNVCYDSKRFFGWSGCYNAIVNAEQVDLVMADPICLMGKSEGMARPQFTFISLLLQYMCKRKGEERMKNVEFFRRAMAVQERSFMMTKALLYWYFKSYRFFHDEMMKILPAAEYGLTQEVFDICGLKL